MTERYGPEGELLLQADRDTLWADCQRRLREGKVGMVEAAILCAWRGAEMNRVPLSPTVNEQVMRLTEERDAARANFLAARDARDAALNERDRLRAALAAPEPEIHLTIHPPEPKVLARICAERGLDPVAVSGAVIEWLQTQKVERAAAPAPGATPALLADLRARVIGRALGASRETCLDVGRAYVASAETRDLAAPAPEAGADACERCGGTGRDFAAPSPRRPRK